MVQNLLLKNHIIIKKKELNINEDFWNTLDKWLSEEVDKETLSELFLTVGTQLQKDINGKDFGVARALDYVKRTK